MSLAGAQRLLELAHDNHLSPLYMGPVRVRIGSELKFGSVALDAARSGRPTGRDSFERSMAMAMSLYELLDTTGSEAVQKSQLVHMLGGDDTGLLRNLENPIISKVIPPTMLNREPKTKPQPWIPAGRVAALRQHRFHEPRQARCIRGPPGVQRRVGSPARPLRHPPP